MDIGLSCITWYLVGYAFAYGGDFSAGHDSSVFLGDEYVAPRRPGADPPLLSQQAATHSRWRSLTAVPPHPPLKLRSNFAFAGINNCGFAFVYFQYAFAATAVTSKFCVTRARK